jgi:hypothetical protein
MWRESRYEVLAADKLAVMRECHCQVCAGQRDAEIEGRGWSVRMAAEEAYAFAYTVGLWHSFGSPEVAIFGRAVDDMVRWLGVIGAQARAGRVVVPDQQPDDVLGDLLVFPRPALASWHRHLFAEGLRFYRGQPVPVVQLTWGDSQGRPPWAEGCEDSCRLGQPRLWDRLDRSFTWRSAASQACWPFPDSPDALVLASERVAYGRAPVTEVVHDEDGEWQFLDGPAEEGSLALVHLAHIVEGRPELTCLNDLPPGWEATRAEPGRWDRAPLDPES